MIFFLHQFVRFMLRNLCLNVLHRPRKQGLKAGVLIRAAGVVHAVLRAFHHHLAQHHLWMFHKIAVLRNPVFINIKV